MDSAARCPGWIRRNSDTATQSPNQIAKETATSKGQNFGKNPSQRTSQNFLKSEGQFWQDSRECATKELGSAAIGDNLGSQRSFVARKSNNVDFLEVQVFGE